MCIDDQGRTPLIIAAMYGKLKVVKFLLTLKGLDVLVKNIVGFDAFDLAAPNCAPLLLQVIEEQSKDFDIDDFRDSFSEQGSSEDFPPLAPRNRSLISNFDGIRCAESTGK